MTIPSDLFERAKLYADYRSMAVDSQRMLGHGSDGSVWRTNRDTAIKILLQPKNFNNELECYRRLQAAGVRELDGFAVPYLEGFDESLLAIEMTIVEPPYILDFGKVYLDIPPPYHGDKQLMKNALREWRSLFGGDWPRVAAVVDALQYRFGIYYVDPRPANINTGREDDDASFASDPFLDEDDDAEE